ncbi:ABC transporter substrate-binding protein [Massilia sp. NR 4-1]|uniref:substrate-binding periplasmic protein n=2 Tax=unclassified Massilia TaxID=2609279 RepID=UPI001CBFB8B8|nr:ABC transporter substrate-binding protein [Massilia sp. NR 4-1]
MSLARAAAARGFSLLLLACMVAVMGANATPVVTEAPNHILLTGQEYPPMASSRLPFGGWLTRVVTEAFKTAGVDAKVEFVPNNRAILGAMSGPYDGSFGWTHTMERDRKLLYSSMPIYTMRMVFFHRRGESYPWKTLEDVRDFRLGFTLGNYYSDELAALQAAKKLRIDETSNDLSNLRKLLVGRIDLFPMGEEEGRFMLKTNFSPEEQARITSQTTILRVVPLYLVIRRSHPHAQELVEKFDRGYKQLADSGQLAKLIEESRKAVLNTHP